MFQHIMIIYHFEYFQSTQKTDFQGFKLLTLALGGGVMEFQFKKTAIEPRARSYTHVIIFTCCKEMLIGQETGRNLLHPR